ncbi:MAG TPA: DUF222 domain-containing protein [Propionicimonas sp.]|nr:DUF222 domain-containing protein [Propionicimonas sp.]
MEERTGLLPVGEALTQIRSVLDRVDPDRKALAPQVRLVAATVARSLTGRLDALASLLLAEADDAGASERTTGTPMSTWMAIDQNLTKREAAGALHRANQLAAHPVLGEAAVSGRVSAGQVRAINTVLDGLTAQLDEQQQARAEQLLVGLADTLDSDALIKSAPQVLAKVAPADANELLERKLQREAEAAHHNRSLRFWRQAGSVRFEGSLPRLAGEQFITLLDAHTEALRRTAVEARDPLFANATPEQRRADAFTHLLNHAATAKPKPGVGSAKVIVKLDYDQLRNGAAGAGVVGDGNQLSAGELRQVCCDADLVPVVLRGGSEVLDVGRSRRLVTPAMRAALIARDGGCVFPGCTAPPSACEAHHVVPWYLGGVTALSNLVLLCHHHHGLVEPAKYYRRDQWQVRINQADRLPEFAPPSRHPQAGAWLRHTRHRHPERTAA